MRPGLSMAPLLLAGIAMAQEALERPALRLPGIVHRWAQPDEVPPADITIDEMGRCMGADLRLRERAQSLSQRQQQLHAALAPLEARSAALNPVVESLTADRSAFEAAVAAQRRQEAALVARKAQVEQDLSTRPASEAEARRIERLVTAFNADLRVLNRGRDKLMREEKALNVRIEDHNRAARALNDSVALFVQSHGDFKAEAERFNEDHARFLSDCTGQRRVMK